MDRIADINHVEEVAWSKRYTMGNHLVFPATVTGILAIELVPAKMT